jgi:pyruvate, water dikinase
MIPFVRTRWEFAECARLIAESGLTRSKNFLLWVMAEVPSVTYWIPEYARLGASGVSIGWNDLTQLMLGVDRDSETLAPLYDERDAAVLDAIQRIISAARAAGMTASICGQAPSVYPDIRVPESTPVSRAEPIATHSLVTALNGQIGSENGGSNA